MGIALASNVGGMTSPISSPQVGAPGRGWGLALALALASPQPSDGYHSTSVLGPAQRTCNTAASHFRTTGLPPRPHPHPHPQNIFAIERMSMDGRPPSWLAWFAVALPVAVASG